jgi:acetylornithine deacetylase
MGADCESHGRYGELTPHMSLHTTLDILSRLVAFDTTSAKSNLSLIAWIGDYLQGLGFRIEQVPNEDGTKANLIASIGPDGSPGYILSGHTDTVPVDDQVWSSDPFRLRRHDGRLYGRGTTDMKGFLAVCLAKAQVMSAIRLSRPLHLAFSYDEEVGCVGVRRMLGRLTAPGRSFAGCFVGEPTGMDVVIGHKGKSNTRVAVTGLGGHSSLAPCSVNAVEYAAAFAGAVQALGRRLKSTGRRDDQFDIPHSTAHVGVLRGGTALNVVPAVAELLFELRTVPGDDAAALLSELCGFACRELEPAMQAVHAEAGFRFDTYAQSPALDNAADAGIVSLTKALAGRNDHRKVAFMTEAGLFQGEAGIPTVVIGPGSIAQAHIADEWIAERELVQCEGFVDNLIQLCQK